MHLSLFTYAAWVGLQATNPDQEKLLESDKNGAKHFKRSTNISTSVAHRCRHKCHVVLLAHDPTMNSAWMRPHCTLSIRTTDMSRAGMITIAGKSEESPSA